MNDPIHHVVLLMLENHSFDQMLGCFKAIYPDLDGVDPKAPNSNTDTDGTVFRQAETDEVQTAYDPKHEQVNVLEQIANGNSGFLKDFSKEYPNSSADDRQQIMGYYGMGKLPALHSLAGDFTICDRWFSSLPGPTWPNRFFALTGTSNGETEMPSGAQQLNPLWYLHETQDTIFDRLNEKNRSWKVYFYDFPNSWLLLHQLKPGNIAKYHHIDTFFNVDTLDEKSFPDFVFIEPKYFGQDQNDDHPPHNVVKAEKLISDVYNAIRSNDELWKSTLLVVTFDEHGGFYDHVTPPPTIAPDDKTSKYDFKQLGVRVPALLVSPWVRKSVNHTVFDHTSLLKYLIDKWGLTPLGLRTASSTTNSVGACIDQQQAREDTTPFIRVPYSDLIPPKPELEKEDVNDHQKSLQMFALEMEKITGRKDFTNVAKESPAFVAVKNWLGKKMISMGNSLTKDFQSLRKAKVQKLVEMTWLTKAKGRETELKLH